MKILKQIITNSNEIDDLHNELGQMKANIESEIE